MKTEATVLILFVSSLTRSTLGFGDSLLAMPLLALVLGIETATPVVALASSTIAMVITLRNWHKIDLNTAWQLVVGSFIGIPIGVLLLRIALRDLVIGPLGIFLILFGLYRLSVLALPTLKGKAWAYVFGFVAGIFGGAYNLNGPFIVLYGTMRRWTPQQFRATLQGYFLPTGLLIVAGHGSGGFWNFEVFKLYLIVLPAVLIAVFIGEKLNKRIPKKYLERLLFIVLIFLGVLLLIGLG